MEAIVKNVGVVNGVTIQIIENDEELVAVKPICEALGIDYSGQLQRIKEDPILGSTMELSPMVASDGKTREMQCLPLKFAFGWLFRIDSRNVKEEAREALITYQMKVYDLLYTYFTSYMKFVNEKQKLTVKEIEKVKRARKEFREAKDMVARAEGRLNVVLAADFESYLAAGGQLNLFTSLIEDKEEESEY
jgi:hypothetical protein